MLNIYRKFDYDSSETSKLYAEDWNAIVDNINGAIEDSGNKLPMSQNDQFIKAVDEIIKHNTYEDIGTVNNIKLSRKGLDTFFENYVDGSYVIFKPKYENTDVVKIQINEKSKKSLFINSGEIYPNALSPNNYYLAIYSETKDAFIINPIGKLINIDLTLNSFLNSISNFDPNTVNKENILTKHNNCPDGERYWFIFTIFNGNPLDGNNRAQLAVEYEATDNYKPMCYVRIIKNGSPRTWRRIDTISSKESIIETLDGGASYYFETLKRLLTKINEVNTKLNDVSNDFSIYANISGDPLEYFKSAWSSEETYSMQTLNGQSIYRDKIMSVENITTEDPTLTIKPMLMTKHANCPDPFVYWYIETFFSGIPNVNSNKLQIAKQHDYPAGETPRVYVRSIVNNVTSKWVKLDLNDDSITGEKLFYAGYKRPSNPQVMQKFLNLNNGNLEMYIYNGIGNVWVTLQEDTIENIPNLILDSDGVIILPGNGLTLVSQETDQPDWVKIKIETFNSVNNFDNKIGINNEYELNLEKVSEEVYKYISKVAISDNHTLAITYNGELYVRGLNYYGQLGVGDYICRTTWEKSVLKNIKQVACNLCSSIILTEDGKVYTTGSNIYGQLGLGDNTHRNNWTLSYIEDPLNPIKKLIAGGYANFILLEDNTALFAGYRQYGGFGYNTDKSIRNWTPISVTNINKIAIGHTHVLISLNNGDLYGTGDDSGCLGLNNGNDQWSFVKLPITGVVDVAAAFNCSMVLKNDGALYGAGYYANGQLGLSLPEDNNDAYVYTWTYLQNLTVLNPTKLYAGMGFSFMFEINTGKIYTTAAYYNVASSGLNYNSAYRYDSTVFSNVKEIYTSVFYETVIFARLKEIDDNNLDGILKFVGYNSNNKLTDESTIKYSTPTLLQPLAPDFNFKAEYETIILNPSLRDMFFNVPTTIEELHAYVWTEA